MDIIKLFGFALFMSILNGGHYLFVNFIYNMLSTPNETVNSDQLETLIYVLKHIIAPVFAMQWLTFEIKALSRIPEDDRFKEESSDEASLAKVLDRIQANGFQ
jgi:hypothetical protein